MDFLNSISIFRGALAQRLSRGVAWSVAAAIASQGSTLVAAILIARLAGRESFGAFGAVQSTVMMLGVFAGMGFGITATRYVAQYRSSDAARARGIVALTRKSGVFSAGLASVLLLISAGALSRMMFGDASIAGLLRAGALTLFCTTWNGCQTGVLAGLERFRSIAVLSVTRALILLPLTFCGVSAWGVEGAVWASGLAWLVICLVSEWMVGRECARSGLTAAAAPLAPEWSALWSFSLPAVLGSLMVAPVNWGVNAWVASHGHGAAELAIWNAAFQWRSILLFLPTLAGQVLVPVYASLGSDQARQRSAIRMAILTALAFALPLALGLAMAAGPLMSAYGSGFQSRPGVLRLVAASGLLAAVETPVGNALVGAGRMWAAFSMNAGWAIVLLTVMLLGPGGVAPADWASFAYLVAYSAHATWIFGYWRRMRPRAGGGSRHVSEQLNALAVPFET